MARRRKFPPIQDVYGTLPDWALKQYIKHGVIKIKGLDDRWEEKLGPVTLDFHLDGLILIPKENPYSYIDVRKGIKEEDYDVVNIPEGGPHILKPGQFIIARTQEKLTLPADIVGRLEGKSSLARLGIVVHLTAGRFDPGWAAVPVLELKNNSNTDVIIYEGWPICAFSFERLSSPVERPLDNSDRYSKGAILSLIHTDHR
ncbi:dCTP deaminase [Candidatus Woesebacteria bacterium RBG_19FT_COMBO_42_9]|uniref:dCTP deaminase n=1 Tax=Candidatus Woesebacteria bacterium RBG_16_42_24 TaxID=1802485 RepID=A0A1F7XJQ7_9BACT|nr:MAG: dCTP deaminase [Candidatus Woesebacteria bacterium RBG_16_42_24]OGM17550.1 MAG: dCTP deaminase [Candidatus Woesebacteria bacterium RBG_19FT_COMBO_42_9]OGM67625.1 MAG: dCTP deaminase [Candidatus Woesebacteria bacterium RIFCSPLOWO2_01_FULL_43_11]